MVVIMVVVMVELTMVLMVMVLVMEVVLMVMVVMVLVVTVKLLVDVAAAMYPLHFAPILGCGDLRCAGQRQGLQQYRTV